MAVTEQGQGRAPRGGHWEGGKPVGHKCHSHEKWLRFQTGPQTSWKERNTWAHLT